MLYALEWYDVPKKAYLEKVALHPYLTEADSDTLAFISYHHKVENSICFLAFSLISNRTLQSKLPQVSRKLFRVPLALALAGVGTYITNMVLFRPLMLSELDDKELTQKYFELDLDKDMMRADLEELGIS
jgi:hypothetical protein